MKVKVLAAVLALSFTTLLSAQKETIEGIRNFTKVDVTFACAGATESAALAGIAARGYKAVINLREAAEAGNDLEASQLAILHSFGHQRHGRWSPLDKSWVISYCVASTGAGAGAASRSRSFFSTGCGSFTPSGLQSQHLTPILP